MRNPTRWHLPHFGVFNPNKPGKMRLVFEAAAKAHGVSLNDTMFSGPDLLTRLVTVLFKFQQREIGFMGDIKEMFHCVTIRDKDLPARRFLWRDLDTSRETDVYQMEAMTFGSTSSPCSAQYVKNKNASDFSHEFPEAAKAIKERHYVDDYADSCHTENDAMKLIADVIELHGMGGFVIRNSTSNSKTVLKSIPNNLPADQEEDVSLGEDSLKIERVLGLKWNPNKNCFGFALNFHRVPAAVIDGSKIPTKRVLTLVMSLYDPLGFLANFTVTGKIILQDIWRSGIGWDDQLSLATREKWTLWTMKIMILLWTRSIFGRTQRQ